MKIVAFLQNQWFKDPDRARRVFASRPNDRERLIALYLFMGCLTGRRLQAAFGADLCNEITWEECSTEIGGKSAAAFPADLNHMRRVIEKHQPDVIMAFGKTSQEAVLQIGHQITVVLITAPHPAARKGAVEGLRRAAEILRASIKSQAECSEFCASLRSHEFEPDFTLDKDQRRTRP